jgi:hypothetical protein
MLSIRLRRTDNCVFGELQSASGTDTELRLRIWSLCSLVLKSFYHLHEFAIFNIVGL